MTNKDAPDRGGVRLPGRVTASHQNVQPDLEPTGAGEVGRGVPRRVVVVWILLMVNVLQFQDLPSGLLPLPQTVFQLVAQASLALAFVLALFLNPAVVVRPNAYLSLLTVMAFLAVAASLRADSGLYSMARSFRLMLFIATLWLLSRWWTGGVHFARVHLLTLGAVLGTVFAGLLISPTRALGVGDGRLAGIIWPIWPTEVGQFSAVALGLAILMWLSSTLSGRQTMLVVAPALTFLVLSHTRTALLGIAIGLTIAVLSMARSSSRARSSFIIAAGLATFGALTVSGPFMNWFSRGQSVEELSGFTGRQQFWDVLSAANRTPGETMFGSGLTDKAFSQAVRMTEQSVDGRHAVDSSWMTAYLELDQVGVIVIGTLLAVLILIAVLRPPSASRACAIFLIVYCSVASYTETGLGDASPYLLHLAVAASLLLSARRPAAAI